MHSIDNTALTVIYVTRCLRVCPSELVDRFSEEHYSVQIDCILSLSIPHRLVLLQYGKSPEEKMHALLELERPHDLSYSVSVVVILVNQGFFVCQILNQVLVVETCKRRQVGMPRESEDRKSVV